MKIYNALDLKKGKKAETKRLWAVSQPLQFIPKKEKDIDWCAWNMDWLEWNGIKQIRRNARRLMKNYKLAKGLIDKTDYIVEEDNEMLEIVDQLAIDDEAPALDLKFYPIIPNVINTLVAEFAKRNTREKTISNHCVCNFYQATRNESLVLCLNYSLISKKLIRI